MPKIYKKTTILFGAGAALAWNAPSTAELTRLVLASGYKMTDNRIYITQFIYDTLIKENNFPPESVNFETIINVVEELIIFYSYFDSEKRSPSIYQCFFEQKFPELLNFSIEDRDAGNHYKLEIPRGFKSDYATRSDDNSTPEQHYFQSLLAEILTAIQARISKYAYHTKTHSLVLNENNAELNALFVSWIRKVKGHNCLRTYTLNYDRNFKVILENIEKPIQLFEGFDCEKEIDYASYIPANIIKILEDNFCDTYYNLHGSAFWHVEPLNQNLLPNPRYYLTTNIGFSVNYHYELPTCQSETGKTILLSNIITGYQKTQKSILAPFKQMQSAFDRDCCFSDKIIIIGYSFNDEHINASIKTSIQYNGDVKYWIIDPSFTSGDFDLEVLIKIFSNDTNLAPPKTIKEGIHSFNNGRFMVFTMTFENFMKYNLAQLYDGDFR